LTSTARLPAVAPELMTDGPTAAASPVRAVAGSLEVTVNSPFPVRLYSFTLFPAS